jgi:tRNA (guanine-N7-)-methyltransferase
MKNPFSKHFRDTIVPAPIKTAYEDPTRPFSIDLGCAKGNFLKKISQLAPDDFNYLGIEIREQLTQEANQWCDSQALRNVRFAFGNVSMPLSSFITDLHPGDVARVSIQFPSPWKRVRHRRRRLVQPELVEELSSLLCVGGLVFLSTDVYSLAVEMCTHFESHPLFCRLSPDNAAVVGMMLDCAAGLGEQTSAPPPHPPPQVAGHNFVGAAAAVQGAEEGRGDLSASSSEEEEEGGGEEEAKLPADEHWGDGGMDRRGTLQFGVPLCG